MSTFDVILLILAAWRLANLVANEEGPFSIFWRLHRWAKETDKSSRVFAYSRVKEGLKCEYCLSVWFGIFLTLGYFILGEVVILWAVLPLVISTGAIIVKHVIFLLQSIDTRFDQQNQEYFSYKQELEKKKASLESLASAAQSNLGKRDSALADKENDK